MFAPRNASVDAEHAPRQRHTGDDLAEDIARLKIQQGNQIIAPCRFGRSLATQGLVDQLALMVALGLAIIL